MVTGVAEVTTVTRVTASGVIGGEVLAPLLFYQLAVVFHLPHELLHVVVIRVRSQSFGNLARRHVASGADERTQDIGTFLRQMYLLGGALDRPRGSVRIP